MIRFPKGRATERVVNDILAIDAGIKRRGPVVMSEPLTTASIVDRIARPGVPDTADTARTGAVIEGETISPTPDVAPTDTPLPGHIARGKNLIDGL